MKFHDKEVIHRMIYHQGYAVRMEQLLIDPDHPQGILVYVFDLDRIDDIRAAISHGYLDFAASYGDLYRMRLLEIYPSECEASEPHYDRVRSLMVESGDYVVEMQIEFSSVGSPWGSGIPLNDMKRANAARAALEQGDLETAARYGKLYRLEPVDIKPAAKPWRPSERLSSGMPS